MDLKLSAKTKVSRKNMEETSSQFGYRWQFLKETQNTYLIRKNYKIHQNFKVALKNTGRVVESQGID